MTIYFSALVATLILSTVLHIKKISSLKNIAFLSIMLLLVLLPSIRGVEVGTDTETYVRIFQSTHNFQDVLLFKMEIGYSIFSFICSFLFTNYFFLLALIALIVVTLYSKLIMHLSVNYFLSFYIFITSGTYVFFFNGARQGIAAALTSYAIIYIIKKNLFIYLFIIILAASFHKTAVIMLPMYYLVNRNNNYKINLMVLALSFLLIVNLDYFIDLLTSIDDRYETYGDKVESGGQLTIAFNIVLGFVFVCIKPFIKKHIGSYNILLNIYLFCIVVSFVALFAQVNPSGLLRLTVYFSWTAIFMWPIVFINIKDVNFRSILYFVTIIFYGIYFYLSLSNFSSMIPFTINPILSF